MSEREGDQDRWLEISVDLAAEFAEPVTHLFSRYGDGRVFVAQTGEWDADDHETLAKPIGTVTVYCYLKYDGTIDHRKGMIDIGLRLMAEIADVQPRRERMVSPDEWENQTFPTIRVGRRIVISPWSLEDGQPESLQPDDIEIFLAPGLAFGTGNHPTTRLCLHQIEEDSERGRIAGSRVLDVGCGSGVLAIAALKLGAANAWCLDIDETAVRAVCGNLAMSGVSERAQVLEGSVPNANLPDTQFDYVFANITSRVLIDIADALIEYTTTNGTILASGILDDQADSVKNAFVKNHACEIVETRTESDWVMLRILKSNH